METTTTITPLMIAALEAFFTYASDIGYSSEGRAFLKIQLETNGAGQVLDTSTAYLHFCFNDMTDLCIKSYISFFDQDLEEGADVQLCYHDKEDMLYTFEEDSHLMIPYTQFREVVLALSQSRYSIREAVEIAIKRKHWSKREGQPFFSRQGDIHE